jgi:hypothetical protein
MASPEVLSVLRGICLWQKKLSAPIHQSAQTPIVKFC